MVNAGFDRFRRRATDPRRASERVDPFYPSRSVDAVTSENIVAAHTSDDAGVLLLKAPAGR